MEQPGEVYEILGEPLYIPCVTNTDVDFVFWEAVISGTSTTIGDSSVGIYDNENNWRQYYELESGHTPRTNFTLKIKSVRLDEPSMRCTVEVPSSPPALVQSSWSAITVVGKWQKCRCMLHNIL